MALGTNSPLIFHDVKTSDDVTLVSLVPTGVVTVEPSDVVFTVTNCPMNHELT